MINKQKRHFVLLFNRHIWGESGSCFINKNWKIILLVVPNVQKLHQKIFAHNLNLKRLLTCNRQTKILGTYLGTFLHTIRLTWNCIQYSSIELHSANNFLPTIRVIRDIFRVNNATVVFKHLDLNVLYNSLPMIGSGPRISNAGSACSINWATTTAQASFLRPLKYECSQPSLTLFKLGDFIV